MKRQKTIAPTPEGRIQRVDTYLDDTSVRLNEKGKVVMRFDAPTDYEGTVPDTFAVSTTDDRTVSAKKVTYDAEDGTLVVRFDDAQLASLVRCGETAHLDLYGEYNSSRYDRIYFEHSRLNADVTATVEVAKTERNETNAPSYHRRSWRNRSLFLEVVNRGAVEHLSFGIEPRPMTRTVPRSLRIVPLHETFHVGTDRRETVQFAVLVAVLGDGVPVFADDSCIAACRRLARSVRLSHPVFHEPRTDVHVLGQELSGGSKRR